jgi:hypothetical protein
LEATPRGEAGGDIEARRAGIFFELVLETRAIGDRNMRNLILVAIALGVAAMPAGGYAATKKLHRTDRAYEAHGAVASDPAGGNAAAGGNNANSMSGSNSAANNAEGRTGGSGGFGH